MKKLKALLTILILVAVCVYAEGEPRPFVVGIPRNVFNAKRDLCARMVWNLWGQKYDQDWCDQGWKACRLKSNTNNVWYLYDITLDQIEDSLSAERIQQLKDILDDNNCKWEFLSLEATMKKYNLEFVP
jgi:hypothetical protein